MNEPGRLAGEPGIELQNPDPDFWPGLGGGGGRASLPKAGVTSGEAIGETAPGRGLLGVEGRGPTVARGIGATALAGVGVCAWSSEVWMGRLPCGLPPGGSMGGGAGRGDEPGSSKTQTSVTSFFLPNKRHISHIHTSSLHRDSIPDILLGPSRSAPG